MSDPAPAVALYEVAKTYRQAGGGLEVLKSVSLSVMPGEIVAVVGPSGAGKSTLLHIAGLLDRPTGGSVRFGDRDCGALGDDRRTALRRGGIGFVYQFHHLLPEFSALENIVLPQMIAGRRRREAAVRARELLGRMGLAERASHRPARLSGGEQQRVAIGRALANRPKVLIADEPTGNLDPQTALSVFEMLLSAVRDHGVAALIATHNTELAARMDRCLELRDGTIQPGDMPRAVE
ncbi:MAG: ABC transporter ATP-binding protein [Defluviicoccus sp.]|nr:ABC transporter ATP-binding protein [Defluviicoccus sp.]MDE0386950.1 ABC transporter ATP-binding protein [Defluviicoccus sp.]